MTNRSAAFGEAGWGTRVSPEAVLASFRRARTLLENAADILRAHETVLLVGGAGRPSLPGAPPPRALGAPTVPRPDVVLRCLGSFRIDVGDEAVDLGPGGKPMAVMKLLAARSRRMPREMLMETLWPESDPATAANRLRVAIYELRRRLAEAGAERSMIVYQHGCYLFNPSSNVRIDADDFEALWQRGVRLERARHLVEATAAYRQAEELYGGDFLEDDPYEDWTLMRREALRDAHLDMLGKLSTYALEQGEYGDCMVYCQKLLLADPCREDAYRMMMRCHAAAGRPARARRWYEICVTTLQRELNVDPSPETVALHAGLLTPSAPKETVALRWAG